MRTSSKSINLFPSKKKKIRNDPSYTLSHMEERWARNTRHVHQLNYAHKQTLRCLLIASPLRKLFGGGPPRWIIPFGIEFHVSRIYIYIYRRKREKRPWPSNQLIVPSVNVHGNKSARVKFLRINHVGRGESEKQDVNSRDRYEVTEPS